MADASLVHPDTVGNFAKRDEKGGLDAPLSRNLVGGEAPLDQPEPVELTVHPYQHLLTIATSDARWVRSRWQMRYTVGPSVTLPSIDPSASEAAPDPMCPGVCPDCSVVEGNCFLANSPPATLHGAPRFSLASCPNWLMMPRKMNS